MLYETTPGGNFQSSESLSQAEIASGLAQLYPSRWDPQRVDFPLMLEHMRVMINMNADFKQKTPQAWDTSVQNAFPENFFVKTLQVPFTTEDVARRDQIDKPLSEEQAKDRLRFLYGVYHTNPEMWLDFVHKHLHEAIVYQEAESHYRRAKRDIDEKIQGALLRP